MRTGLPWRDGEAVFIYVFREKLARGKGGGAHASIEVASFTCFFVGDSVANVVDALEDRDDFFIVRDDDDGGVKAPGHNVEN
mgnify:CR=1 FL=1